MGPPGAVQPGTPSLAPSSAAHQGDTPSWVPKGTPQNAPSPTSPGQDSPMTGDALVSRPLPSLELPVTDETIPDDPEDMKDETSPIAGPSSIVSDAQNVA